MQKVINWLRSDEGSAWSEDRMAATKPRDSGRLTVYGCSAVLYYPGIMCLKPDVNVAAQWRWTPSGNDAQNDRRAP